MAGAERFTDEEIVYLVKKRDEDEWEWAKIASDYSKKFGAVRSADTLKHAYHRYRSQLDDTSYRVKLLRDNARTKRAASTNGKEFRELLKAWDDRDDILDAVKTASKAVGEIKAKVPVHKPSAKKKSMTLELLISDIHIGKKTEKFNLEVAKRRLAEIRDTVLGEIARSEAHYSVDRVIIAMIGDMIESATMHGVESRKGCEFGNPRQIHECLTLLFSIIVEPIAMTGRKVDCVGVTGNHDRTEYERTYHNPGEENVTYIIYNTMKDFTEMRGLSNVTWHIPVGPHQLLDIYGENVLYEHYDNSKGSDQRKGIESLMSKRTNQISRPIRFIRGGHFHEPSEFGLGKIVINGSLPGNDSFSEILGFDCEPTQTLNFYIERSKDDRVKRTTSFYKRLLIQLS